MIGHALAATAHLWIESPLDKQSKGAHGWFNRLFATHPPMETASPPYTKSPGGSSPSRKASLRALQLCPPSGPTRDRRTQPSFRTRPAPQQKPALTSDAPCYRSIKRATRNGERLRTAPHSNRWRLPMRRDTPSWPND